MSIFFHSHYEINFTIKKENNGTLIPAENVRISLKPKNFIAKSINGLYINI